MNCENCKHLKCIPMVCRGVMDCDPPEEYCDLDLDTTDDECDMFEERTYDYDYNDYLLDRWEEER